VNAPRMPIGISSFEMLREDGFYYVDKSQFVVEIAESVSAILLLPRPRRFGKTLNMTMLQAWYECRPDGSNVTHLFEGLRAASTEGRHQPRKGKLPVIFLTLVLPAFLWVELKASAVKQNGGAIVREVSETTGCRLNRLDF
jgi:hypothetical protein